MQKESFSIAATRTLLLIINEKLYKGGEIDHEMMEHMKKEIASLEISRESSYN